MEDAAMTRTRQILVALIACAALAPAAVSQAQSSGYRPWKPTISPWFSLYNRNRGPLDNYNMYVRPETELRDTLQQQASGIQRNSAGLRSLGHDVNQLQEEGPIRPTGTGSGFMNYSHYYPALGQGKAAARHGTSSPKPASSGRSASSRIR
jgi:hypothetical protein